MSGYLTLLLSGVAALIASMQWFVARQRFVLDLFDRRFEAYNDVLNAVRPIVGNGSAKDHNQLVDLQIAIQNSKFLFGSDVNDYLQGVWKAVVDLRFGEAIYNTNNARASEAPGIMENALKKLNDMFNEYPRLCERYMMMPEKRVRTPIEWFNDRNAIRKSYGSEPKNVSS